MGVVKLIVNQDFIFNWFVKQRSEGNQGFFTIVEITEALKNSGYDGCLGNVRKIVKKLYAWGYLDLENFDTWRRAYRVKFGCMNSKLISPLDKDLKGEQYKWLYRG